MRLNPGITVELADDELHEAETTWSNALSADAFWPVYTKAVHDTYPRLKRVFADQDIGAALRSPAYWNLMALGNGPASKIGTDAFQKIANNQFLMGLTKAIKTEIEDQVKALAQVRDELRSLQELVSRPGLPVVYDTNVLNHWQQPSDIKWREILKSQGETADQIRLVVPLRVLDELDRQKYGQGELARKAGAAVRYLERVLADAQEGRPVELRPGATLEVWVDTDDRGGDADLSILRCAADLDNLHPATGARVLTNDFGMRLRAQQMGLKVMRLPEDLRKRTAPANGPSQGEKAASGT